MTKNVLPLATLDRVNNFGLTFDLADILDLFDSDVYCIFTNSANPTSKYID